MASRTVRTGGREEEEEGERRGMVVDMETTVWHGPSLLQDGCHSSGWYEDALRQIFWCSSNLPLGWRGREREREGQAVWPGQEDKQPHTVMRMMLGGFMGYSEGRMTLPW